MSRDLSCVCSDDGIQNAPVDEEPWRDWGCKQRGQDTSVGSKHEALKPCHLNLLKPAGSLHRLEAILGILGHCSWRSHASFFQNSLFFTGKPVPISSCPAQKMMLNASTNANKSKRLKNKARNTPRYDWLKFGQQVKLQALSRLQLAKTMNTMTQWR